MAAISPQAHGSGSRQNKMANISISHAGGATAAYPAFDSDQSLNEIQSPCTGMNPTLDQNPNASFPTPGNSLFDLASVFDSGARGESSFLVDDLNDCFAIPTPSPNSYLAVTDRIISNSGENSHQNLALGLGGVAASPWSHLSATEGRNTSFPGSVIPTGRQHPQRPIHTKRPSTRSAASGRASFIDSAYSTLPQEAQHEDEVMQDLSEGNMNHVDLKQGPLGQQHGQQALPQFYAPSQQSDFSSTYNMPTGSQQHFVQSPTTTPTPSTQTNHRNQAHHRPQIFPCNECEFKAKTRSELNKHNARHQKKFKCTMDECKVRHKCFPTSNDLDRHLKSVHHINNRRTKDYKCFARDCTKPDKTWPRLDNFKQHLKSMHGNEDLDELLRRSDQWFDQERQHSMLEQHDEIESNHAPSRISTTDMSEINNSMMQLHTSITPPYTDHTTPYYSGMMTSMTGPQPFPLNVLDPRLLAQQHQPQRSRDRGISSPIPPTNTQRRPMPHPITTTNLSPQNPPMQRALSQIGHPQQQGSMSNTGNHNRMVGFVQTPDFSWNMNSVMSMSAGSQHLNIPPPRRPKRPHTTPNPGLDANRMTEFATSPVEMHASIENGTKELLSNIGGSTDVNDLPTSSKTPTFLFSPPDDEPKTLKTIGKVLEEEIHNFLQQHKAQVDQERSLSQEDLKRLRLSLRTTLVDTITNPDSSSRSHTGVFIDTDQSPSVGEKKSSQNERGGFACTVEGCDKIMDKQSTLKKHIKRHKRLWGCTFDGCNKVSGSKNDWKRHEQGQHRQQECWRCPHCLKIFYQNQEAFISHVMENHSVKWREEAVKQAQSCRIAKNYQCQFWCGFCVKIVVHDKHGDEAISTRFDHIDRHFIKEEKSNSSWVELGGFGKTKAALNEQARMQNPANLEEKEDEDDDNGGEQETQDESDSPGSDESSPEQHPVSHYSSTADSRSQGMGGSSGSSLNPDQMAVDPQWTQQFGMGQPSAPVVGPQPPAQSIRRIRSQMMSSVSGSNRPEHGLTAQFIVCCQCKVPYSIALSKSCDECRHQACYRCKVGVPSFTMDDVNMTM